MPKSRDWDKKPFGRAVTDRGVAAVLAANISAQLQGARRQQAKAHMGVARRTLLHQVLQTEDEIYGFPVTTCSVYRVEQYASKYL